MITNLLKCLETVGEMSVMSRFFDENKMITDITRRVGCVYYFFFIHLIFFLNCDEKKKCVKRGQKKKTHGSINVSLID